jgi:hypothetical protein
MRQARLIAASLYCNESLGSRFQMLCKLIRQAIYVLHNTEGRSCHHCRSGKAIIIIYSEFVFANLGN